MTRKQRAYLHIIILPFVISAAVEFLPAWLYWPIGYLCENAVGQKYFRLKKPSSVYKPVALYAKEQA